MTNARRRAQSQSVTERRMSLGPADFPRCSAFNRENCLIVSPTQAAQSRRAVRPRGWACAILVCARNSSDRFLCICGELVGANDIRNLWPEACGSGPYDAHLRDKLENRPNKKIYKVNIEKKRPGRRSPSPLPGLVLQVFILGGRNKHPIRSSAPVPRRSMR
jgi:hypothetical protein